VREVARAVRTKRALRRRQASVSVGAHLEAQVAAVSSRGGSDSGGDRASRPGHRGGQRRATATSRFQRLTTYVWCPTGVRQPSRHQYKFLAIILVIA